MAGGGDPRESATESKPPRSVVVRVKGWGKSPPRDWQQERHGKPHREQDRIGAVRGETLEGCFRLTARVGCVRRMATCAQDEWPPRSRAARGEGHTEPGLQASWQFSSRFYVFVQILGGNSLISAGCVFGALAGSGASLTESAFTGLCMEQAFLETGAIKSYFPKARRVRPSSRDAL